MERTNLFKQAYLGSREKRLNRSAQPTRRSPRKSVWASLETLKLVFLGPIVLLASILIGSPCDATELGFEEVAVGGKSVAVQPGSITAVCFLGTECPMARAYATTLSALQDRFRSDGVVVIGVMSNVQDSAAEVAEYADELNVRFPLVLDQRQEIADRYGAQRTPEVFLLDENLQVRYHGRIDDRYAPGVSRADATRSDLEIALQEVISGKPVSKPETLALGCIIGRAKQQASLSAPEKEVTFTQHISRVIARNCLECHRSHEIGPFSMEEYEDVVGWADTMLETVENGRMPPWHASPEHGRFLNARTMLESDKQLLRDWIAGGKIQGDPTDLPEPPNYVTGWQLPKQPDIVLDMRTQPFKVPSHGVVEYQYFVVDPGFDEDRWVSAAQIIPGEREVVHHAIVFVRPPDGSVFKGIGWLTAYVPGQRLAPLQPGHARKIPAHSKLVFQMHYTPNGEEQLDTSQLGIVFADAAQVTHEVYTLAAIDQEFEIPPGEPAFQVEAALRNVPDNGQLLAATPHMHFRGKSFTLFEENDGKEILLDVPAYDFNWQHTYHFVSPRPLAEVKSLRFRATFDNSAENAFNPDPSQWVHWGDQSWEEMAVAFFEVAVPLHTSGPPAVSEISARRSQEIKADRQAKIDQYVARAMKAMDANRDGVITLAESPAVVRRNDLWPWDQNQDGIATRDELRVVAERIFH
ncbi:MAG: redoxin domain-containing protein [Planctomycetales bacterium]|nr:redoxin domain-containing protein [Planctomycetales bacterium]